MKYTVAPIRPAKMKKVMMMMAASFGVERRWIMESVSDETSDELMECTEEEVLTRSDLLPLLVALPLPIFAFSSSHPLYAMV